MRECNFFAADIEDCGTNDVEIRDFGRIERQIIESIEFHYRGMREAEICSVRIRQSDDYIRTLKIFLFVGNGRRFLSFCSGRIHLFTHDQSTEAYLATKPTWFTEWLKLRKITQGEGEKAIYFVFLLLFFGML